MTAPRTLLDKVWDAHVVVDLGEGWSLIHVDRTCCTICRARPR